MSRKHLATRAAALSLLLGVLGLGAPPALAIEIELPGERTFNLNGFYELRLQFLGEDLPGNGISPSQFVHVLSLETELEIFPDGFGPFDFMMAYTRWSVIYDCAYQGGCLVPGNKNARLFSNYNYYGGDNPKRLPRNIRAAETQRSWNGGVIYGSPIPGTLRSTIQNLNTKQWIAPGNVKLAHRRFRGPINPPGIFSNPDPLAVFANLNARSKLDPPTRQFANGFTKIRAAAYNSDFNINYLQFARTSLTPDNYDALFGKILTGQFLRPIAETGIGQGASGTGSLRARNTAILQTGTGRLVTDDAGLTEAEVIEERNLLLFTPLIDPDTFEFVRDDSTARVDLYSIDPFYVDPYKLPETAEFLQRNLIETRPDVNRYELLARQTSVELLNALWASNQLPKGNLIPYLATIKTPIRPLGYFNTGRPIDIVEPFATGLATDLVRIDTLQIQTLGGTQNPDQKNKVVPRFFGPDGVRNTADDLPFASGTDLVLTDPTAPDAVYGTWDGVDTITGLRVFDSVAQIPDAGIDGRPANAVPGGTPLDQPYVLYAQYNTARVQFEGCRLNFGNDPGACVVAGSFCPVVGFQFGNLDPNAPVVCQTQDGQIIEPDVLTALGCKTVTTSFKTGGVNLDGDCIALNTTQGTPGSLASSARRGVALEVVDALGDRAFRPSEVDLEPSDLTDAAAFSEKTSITSTGEIRGQAPPARPRNPDGSVFYPSAGQRKTLATSDQLVGSLDLDFGVDALRWNHGASDDTHEFREGYLEFEMFDSQLFARVGRLIMVWGKTELFRNQDRLNPVNISNGVITRLEEARIGQFAANITVSPEAFMRLGPIEDLRVELAWIFDDWEPTDLGICGESRALSVVCGKAFGAYAHGLTGIGVLGERRPDHDTNGLKKYDYGIRLEGRWDRFTFAVTDFWGWEDAFFLEPVGQYVRRVDPETGAPVNNTGGLGCLYRTAFNLPVQALPSGSVAGLSGTGNAGLSGGPDGDITTIGDNLIPSVGNCLLFDNPTSANGAQTLRASDQIALSQAVNQTLFHTLCTLTFDPDQGFCAFDRLTNPEQFQLIGLAFSGQVSAALAGVKTIKYGRQLGTAEIADLPADDQDQLLLQNRIQGDPYAPDNPFGRDPGIQLVLTPLEGTSSQSDALLPFTPEQGALLGCGPSFASACGTFDQNFVRDANGTVVRRPVGDDSFESAIGLNDLTDQAGGVDFMNADGSVITQEFTVLKAASPGAMVATRNRKTDGLLNNALLEALRWEAGITIASQSQDQLAAIPDANLMAQGLTEEDLTAQGFAPLTLSQRADRIEEIATAAGSDNLRSDGWVEPFPWELDQESLAQGRVLYKIADLTLRDPRCATNVTFDAEGEVVPRPTPGVFSPAEVEYCAFRQAGWTPAQADVLFVANDPTDPTNPINEFIDDYERIADVCSPFATNPQSLSNDQAFLDEFVNTPNPLFPWQDPGDPADPAEAFLFNENCTLLENFSSNLERFLMLVDMVGLDNQFDAPESVAEMIAMLDGDFSNDHFGDPVAGPDGIFTRNARVFADDEVDTQVVVTAQNSSLARITIDDALGTTDFNGTEEEFFDQLNLGVPAASGGVPGCELSLFGGSTQQYLTVGERNKLASRSDLTQNVDDIIAALPLCAEARTDDFVSAGLPPNFPIKYSPLYLANAADVNCSREDGECASSTDMGEGQIILARLLAGEVVEVNTLNKNPITGEDVIANISLSAQQRRNLLTEGLAGANIDNDSEGIRDLDQDQDGIWDGADDYSPGPISDDNILCGSGLPGDLLQNAEQFDLYNDDEIEAAEAAFGVNPDGSIAFPARSPTGCRGVSALLSATTQTLPLIAAGGDGRYGRRDFLWQGGREVVFDYQKRNVFGFALDFAEDNTKTSWGIEASWTSNLLIPNTNEFDGLSQSDIIVLSVSVDRPTFFNFLNPNRSFFLNFQFFMQYLTDYEGGGGAHDGNYGRAESAFSVPIVTFTFFTGYFQDRLAPRTTFVYDPHGKTGGVLWGLSYRWSGNFSTSISANNFFGDGTTTRRSIAPITGGFGNPELKSASLRGLTPVVNRDTVFLTVRYSW